MKNTKKGFTLLEMLVVIGIIAVLVAVAATSFSTAQKKARDAKRKGDVRGIQNAVEQYYSLCGYAYPTPAAGNTLTGSLICPSTLVNFMTFPTDPLGGAYTMSATTPGSDYTICPPTLPSSTQMLETDTSCTTASPATKTCCVTNRQ